MRIKQRGFIMTWVLLLLLPLIANSDFSVYRQDGQAIALNRYGFSSQNQRLASQYPFINVAASVLKFHGDESSRDMLYSRMEAALLERQTTLNIVHLGGSHVQAGWMGQRIREHFNGLSPGSIVDRGLLVPLRVGKSNSTALSGSMAKGDWSGCRCSSRKDHCTWGMSGFTITTETDSAELILWANQKDSVPYSANEVRLYYNHLEPHLTPEWVGNARVDSSRSFPEQGFQTWWLSDAADTLKFRFVADSASGKTISVHGAWLKSNAPGIRFTDIGVNGASTASYLRCEQMPEQFASLAADLVFFGIGVNDAHVRSRDFNADRFIQRYDSLLARLQAQDRPFTPIFLTNTDNFYKGAPNLNGLKVQKAMHALAEKHNGAVYDIFEVMGGTGSIASWLSAGLARKDRIHLTREGYFMIADLLYTALIDDFALWLHERSLSQHTITGNKQGE